jgi:hypothetical protein
MSLTNFLTKQFKIYIRPFGLLRNTKTAVAQWAKTPGIHCYVAGSIPVVTPRYCTRKIEKCSLEHKKRKKKKYQDIYKKSYAVSPTKLAIILHILYICTPSKQKNSDNTAKNST